jgi:polyhydroxybutyrate depolymerase
MFKTLDESTPVGKWALTPGDYRRMITVDGRRRYYDLHVPPSYGRDKPMPLVLNLHGGGGNSAEQRNASKMDAVADRAGFIVAYPAGSSGPIGSHLRRPLLVWNIVDSDGYAVQNNIDDLAFFRRLIDDSQQLLHVDSKRVYACGYSQGGMMCFQMACAMADKIAAIAAVSSTMTGPLENCRPSRPMPIIMFHGTDDPIIPYNGGVGAEIRTDRDYPRRSVSEVLNYWVAHNKLPAKRLRDTVKARAQCAEYGADQDAAPVISWTLQGGGHTWPGGESSMPKLGAVNRDINASEVIWDFFKKYSLP